MLAKDGNALRIKTVSVSPYLRGEVRTELGIFSEARSADMRLFELIGDLKVRSRLDGLTRPWPNLFESMVTKESGLFLRLPFTEVLSISPMVTRTS